MAHNRTRASILAGLGLAMVLAATTPCVAETGLPLPRFVSLRADEVNLRAGPGTSYPVEWVLLRRDWPVEIIAEYETWRRIRDVDGTVGWVHQTMLSGDRTVIVTDAAQTLLASPEASSAPVLRAEPGVVGALLTCNPDRCRVEIDGVRGWIDRAHVFGVRPDETFE